MARRRDNSSEGVSLFPFMSILACLIGILTLLISVSMQVKQMQDKGLTEEEKQSATKNRDFKLNAERLEKSIAKLQIDLQREKASAAQFAKLQERETAMQKKLAEVSKGSAKSEAEIQQGIDVMRKEIAALKKEPPVLNMQLKKRQQELALRKNPPKPKESVVIKPGGSGRGNVNRLFFVECNAAGIVLRSDHGTPKPIPTAKIIKSPEYERFLQEAKSTRNSMVLFLIRKTGPLSYRWAAGHAESKYGVLTGKLPIPNDGEIDLSLFSK